MAVTLLAGHVSRALDFYNKSDIYLGLGKTTPWEEGESNPPTPLNTDSLVEIAGYKKVESKFLVIPDDTGTGELSYQNRRWKIVPYDQAIAKGARWVYISTYIAYNEFPTDLVYRQIGVFTGLKVKSSVTSSSFALTPDQVESQGIPEALDNRTPIYREADQRERLTLIIEF